MIAKIADDLHHSLLLGRTLQETGSCPAKEPLPREFQDGIVFTRGPEEIAGLGRFDEFLISSSKRTDVKPRKYNVDREIGDPLLPKQRLRVPKRRRFQCPAVAPEIIVGNLDDL